jgi:hypothetical protein
LEKQDTGSADILVWRHGERFVDSLRRPIPPSSFHHARRDDYPYFNKTDSVIDYGYYHDSPLFDMKDQPFHWFWDELYNGQL